MTTEPKRIIWGATKGDAALIGQIVQRAIRETKVYKDRLECEMDLTAAHLNGCPLDLKRLRDAPEYDFHHDISGIRQHIDRNTGTLLNCFLPRCAMTQEAA